VRRWFSSFVSEMYDRLSGADRDHLSDHAPIVACGLVLETQQASVTVVRKRLRLAEVRLGVIGSHVFAEYCRHDLRCSPKGLVA
jgi:hypothetical protein